MDSSQFTVALLVANQFGVLTRVSGLFARRGFNIDSLTVGATQDPRFSRMTISAQGDDYIRGQIVRQLEKLEDVKTVQLMDESRTVLRSLMIVKVKLEKGRQSILEAGLEAGVELPYSCKGGVCSTCRAKLVAGDVDMDVNVALEDYEVARGFVLTCQSYPVTDRVTVDYDLTA